MMKRGVVDAKDIEICRGDMDARAFIGRAGAKGFYKGVVIVEPKERPELFVAIDDAHLVNTDIEADVTDASFGDTLFSVKLIRL